MTTKLVPSLEEMALLKFAVTIYCKLIMKSGVRRVPPDAELVRIKDVVPKLKIPESWQGKLENILTLLSFERYRRGIEKKLLKRDKKYSLGWKMRPNSEGYDVLYVTERTSHGIIERSFGNIPGLERIQF
ncbi:hypothetical protein TNCV_753711 [Trichonephila clavipes]|nr:hypothetical protein TNCV_753711 [Trichonephila clavipes]